MSSLGSLGSCFLTEKVAALSEVLLPTLSMYDVAASTLPLCFFWPIIRAICLFVIGRKVCPSTPVRYRIVPSMECGHMILLKLILSAVYYFFVGFTRVASIFFTGLGVLEKGFESGIAS